MYHTPSSSPSRATCFPFFSSPTCNAAANSLPRVKLLLFLQVQHAYPSSAPQHVMLLLIPCHE
ncbi:hypothetical protein B7P43_G08906 [Cryptotermes secundus]|uniref:Uncharacterized protein n=1 Tax=Cryptotermes secundus TaxID=105785 RepID=A0A2J7QTC5_9NEOP|nr:hypothetical protein B7P43_G08906 [Cryptotermes secundus]